METVRETCHILIFLEHLVTVLTEDRFVFTSLLVLQICGRPE